MTVGSTASVAYQRYQTGGRTWIGQIKAADKVYNESIKLDINGNQDSFIEDESLTLDDPRASKPNMLTIEAAHDSEDRKNEKW